jgi:histidyl-tRNA synthetase
MEFITRVEVQRELDVVSFDDIASLLPSSIDKKLIEPLRYIDVNVRSGLPTASVRFDPTLVRGMGYYTGPIFEIEVEGMTSSIAGGGRYDGMIGRFGDKSVPACGFSLGFERIVELLPVQIEKSPMRLALFYDESIESGALLRNQISLVNHGYEVRAIRRPRKLGKSIEALAREGFGSFVELTESNHQSFSVKDVRPISSDHLVAQS